MNPKFLILIVVVLLFISCQKETKLPNIVLIVADDLGYADMSCTGLSSDVNTPNIDKLSTSGTRFTKAYATSPICNPSRCGIITGSYQERFGTMWYGGNGIADSSFRTIPELLKQQNYHCGYIGKVHYGHADSDTNHRNFPLNHGFDYFFGFTSPRKHYLNHSNKIEHNFISLKKKYHRKGQSLNQQALWDGKKSIDTVAFSTELFGKKACEYIVGNKDNPFFLQLSFNAVHNFTHQLPDDYLKKHGLTGISDWNPETEEYYDWYKRGRFPNNPHGRELYLGQLHFLDSEVGRVIQCLKENGLYENTMIIFISDNGGSTPIYANNYPLRGSKYVLYEGGIRVPLIISYPAKYPKEQTSNNMVSAMDILPTICQAVGIKIPNNIDGIGLNELLSGSKINIAHDSLYFYTTMEKALVTDTWKYHEVMDLWDARYEMVELDSGKFLYNLREDIGEKNNYLPNDTILGRQLELRINQWMSEIGIK